MGTDDLPSSVTALAVLAKTIITNAQGVLGTASPEETVAKLASIGKTTIQAVENSLNTNDIPATVTALADLVSKHIAIAEKVLNVQGPEAVIAKIAVNYLENFNFVEEINPKTYVNNFKACTVKNNDPTQYTEFNVVQSDVRSFDDITIACAKWGSGSALFVQNGECSVTALPLAYCLGATEEVPALWGFSSYFYED